MFKRITYKDVLYEWLENKRKTNKESTYLKYLSIIDTHIINTLGTINFKELKPSDIISFFNSDEIDILSNSSKNIILIVINSSINYGIERKYRKSFDNIDLKFKKDKNELTYFTLKEQKILEEYIYSNMNIKTLPILVSLYTGMRIGEICGLKGSDIDFVNNNISINRTVQRVKNIDGDSKTKLVIGKPKTKSSIRIIPVPEFIINLLKQYVEDKNNYVFTGTNKPKDPRTLEKYFTNLLKKLNLKSLNFHTLRHSYSTRLREQKVDIKVISILLGHANWKITQDTYVHASLDSIRQSINELGNLCR